MEILLATGYTALFLFLIHRLRFFRLEIISSRWIKLLFLFKVAAGCILGLIYTYYYTERVNADTFKFFDDSKILFNTLFTQPKQFLQIFFGVHDSSPECFEICTQMIAWNNKDVLFNDNKTLVRLNVIFQFFSVGKYYVHVVFLNFFSFTGLIALFKLFQSSINKKSKLLFVFTMFLPSVLFWGSGMLKDGLLLFALGVLLYSFRNLISSSYSFRSVIAVLIGLSLLMFTKLYVLVIVIPSLIAWYWSRKDNAMRVGFKFLICHIIYFIIGFNSDLISEKYDVVDLIFYKHKSFNVLVDATKASSAIQIPEFDPTPASILLHAPSAVLRVLTRPSIFDSHSPLILLSAIENILLILLGLTCLFFSRWDSKFSPHLFWLSIYFVVCMYSLIGLITPVLGAMVRYKVPALLFLIYCFIAVLDIKKITSRFPILKKIES
ncbi:hypothetical protein BH11BAC1_BH11BAC1_14830 [soil metagenome]